MTAVRRALMIASLLSIVAATGVAAQAPDPATIVDAYTAAINAGNVDAALAFVDDDAIYRRPAGVFKGKDEVRGFIEDLIGRKAKIELVGSRESLGDYIYWNSRVTFGEPGAGPAEIRNFSQSIVSNGKILFHMARPAPAQ